MLIKEQACRKKKRIQIHAMQCHEQIKEQTPLVFFLFGSTLADACSSSELRTTTAFEALFSFSLFWDDGIFLRPPYS